MFRFWFSSLVLHSVRLFGRVLFCVRSFVSLIGRLFVCLFRVCLCFTSFRSFVSFFHSLARSFVCVFVCLFVCFFGCLLFASLMFICVLLGFVCSFRFVSFRFVSFVRSFHSAVSPLY